MASKIVRLIHEQFIGIVAALFIAAITTVGGLMFNFEGRVSRVEADGVHVKDSLTRLERNEEKIIDLLLADRSERAESSRPSHR